MLYTDAIDPVLTRAEGCPLGFGVDALRNAAIEFCTKTQCMTTGAQVTATAGGVQIPLDLTTMWIVSIIDARINGEPVPVVAMNDPCIEEATSEYPVLLFAEPSGLFLLPEPTIGVPIDLMLAVAPGFLSTEAPDLLWQRHSEAMLHGALSRLLAEPGKVWSNPQFAGYCRQMFDAEITKQAALYGRNRITNAQWLRSRPA